MQHWQLDCKDASSVAADPPSKKQQVVETINLIDKGTSVLMAHHVRSDCSAETALASVVETMGSTQMTSLHHHGPGQPKSDVSKSISPPITSPANSASQRVTLSIQATEQK